MSIPTPSPSPLRREGSKKGSFGADDICYETKMSPNVR
jgi:hypothetical protein